MCHKRLTVSFFLYWVLKKRHLCLNFLLLSHKWSSIRLHFSNLGVQSTQKRLFNESQLSSEVLSFRGPNIMGPGSNILGPWLQCNGKSDYLTILWAQFIWISEWENNANAVGVRKRGHAASYSFLSKVNTFHGRRARDIKSSHKAFLQAFWVEPTRNEKD